LDIVLATGNPGKRKEFLEILEASGARQIRLVAPSAAALPVAETGRSHLANARLKAQAAAHQYSMPALGDDSGLHVDFLGGAPGLGTARFGGPGLTTSERVELLLKRMNGVATDDRTAHFVCALHLSCPEGRGVAARGIVRGRIARAPRGTNGFGYDPVFILPGVGLTLAEIEPAQKHQVSHRGRALRILLSRLPIV
jgi:XTP/dITP diphosphohydrolase